jgi:aminoglycoside phosphotransferase (APT) family kinase protein
VTDTPIEVAPEQVRRLLADQFPTWADLPLTPVLPGGTDHVLFRLGDALVARLPRRPSAAVQVERERRWLPVLADALPLALPVPVAAGGAGHGYPWSWSVCRFLPGQDAAQASPIDMSEAAVSLGMFVAALLRLPTSGAPRAGRANHGRGVALARVDARVRRDLASIADEVDAATLSAVWDEALAAPPWTDAPAWLHGDLHPGNLLIYRGRLAGVLDWGLMGVGDPACDLIPAWNWCDPASRARFRAAAPVTAADWQRGRGWAIYSAVIALAFNRRIDSPLVAISRRTLAEVVSEGG